ncbi:MAG TPA: hypothetical protein VMT88_11115 [Actinomycetes bacterium]|nr:hypothetical protein [Actinomycetes bacterium]
MTLVLVAPTGEAGLEEALYQRWVRQLSVSPDPVYVVAPANVDVGSLEHVAADANESDVLAALADIAHETSASLTVIDASRTEYGPLALEWAGATDATSQLLSDPGHDGVAIVHLAATDVSDAERSWRRAAARAHSVSRSDSHSESGPGPDAPTDVVRAALEVLTSQGLEVSERHEFKTVHPGRYVELVIRPIARPLLNRARRMGFEQVSITVLTTASVLAAALLAAAGSRLSLILAALFLQTAVIAQVVGDGLPIPARRRPEFPAWLNPVMDVVKVAILMGGLAIGGRGTTDDIWLVAGAVIVVWTARAIVAMSYEIRMNASDGERFSGSPFSLPNAEFFLVLSLAMLVLTPRPVLWVAIAVLGISLLYILLRELLAPPNVEHPPRLSAEVNRELFYACDPGPLAVVVGREDPQLSLLRRLAASVVGWLVPLSTWVIEVAVLAALAVWKDTDALAMVFLLASVVAFHRVDSILRPTLTGHPVPDWLAFVSLGALGRPILYLLLAATDYLDDGLVLVTLIWAVVFAAEAASSWTARPESES